MGDDGPERPWEEDCEQEGLDYDECIDRFYDDVNDIQNDMMKECIQTVNDE